MDKNKNGEGNETSTTMKPPFAMDYEKHRDDQRNTGVIAALLGGFALSNSWNIEIDGTIIGTVMYVLSIVAVHTCTCSALTSAFLFQTLTSSDPEKAVLWMEKHSFVASLPFSKFAVGATAYLASVMLVAFKGLAEEYAAQVITTVIGVSSFCIAIGMLCFLRLDSPSKMAL